MGNFVCTILIYLKPNYTTKIIGLKRETVMNQKVILASQSPRRAEILAAMGVEFVQQGFDVDENILPMESPSNYLARVVAAKCDAAQASYQDEVVIVADTVVLVGDQLLMKPDSYQTYVNYMYQLSGKTHQVMTAVMVAKGAKRQYDCVTSNVLFAELSDDMIRKYWASGEPKDKAGGYGIQGKGALFVKKIEGSFHAIMGLPVYETGRLLEAFGVEMLR